MKETDGQSRILNADASQDKKYNDALCTEQRGEINNLLVFVCVPHLLSNYMHNCVLLSVFVTAFLIDSYKWLLSMDSDATLLPTQVQKRINVYWFASLLLALSSASTAMLCKEWLRKFITGIDGSSQDASSIQYERCCGVSAWQVTGIISTISVLLQVALVLFFVGVLELLWQLDKTVAITSTITIAPCAIIPPLHDSGTAIQYFQVILRSSSAPLPPQCPYKSPQSWIFVALATVLYNWWTPPLPPQHQDAHFQAGKEGPPQRRIRNPDIKLEPHLSWNKYDPFWVLVDPKNPVPQTV
ncbi:hypothetical protein EDD18DRAFT_1356257 [Armillaria luteobubalina]|uniref:DUF6535 domain-containing protein n=1 Tax=Armillaria luteobubalina TaxID=153913 RepID=A0AA39UR55_9AGAR|nr:hypothetical protein EDD18DRAFT_1356257 [Armillaria luteobubalina]